MPGINDDPEQVEQILADARSTRGRRASAASACTCAARCAASSWSGCAPTARIWSSATRSSTRAAPICPSPSANGRAGAARRRRAAGAPFRRDPADVRPFERPFRRAMGPRGRIERDAGCAARAAGRRQERCSSAPAFVRQGRARAARASALVACPLAISPAIFRRPCARRSAPRSRGRRGERPCPSRMPTGATSTSPRSALDRLDDAGGDLLGRAGADALGQLGARLVEHAGVADEAGEHGRDADAARAEIAAQALAEAAQAELRGAVDRAARLAGLARQRRDEHDVAAPARRHPLGPARARASSARAG